MDRDRSAHWDKVYGEKADADLSWHQDSPAVSLDLARLAGLSADWAVIDVGGGTSRLADRMIDLGVRDLTVVDLSRGALEATRRRLGARGAGIGWVAADITTWEPPRQYDLWHDRAVFHFLVEPGDRDAYVERVSRSLRGGGHAIIATFAPDGPETCSGLPVMRYCPESLGAVLGDRFELVAQRYDVHQTPWGRPQSFQFSLFRRAL